MESKICVVCQHRNDMDALRCSQCGTSFQENVLTPVVPSQFTAPEFFEQLGSQVKKQAPSAIALYINGEKQPILIESKGQTILGRNINSEHQNKVDLTNYYAHLLGVSRQHAILTFADEGCTLEDLNSTNGTWLNEERLVPHQPYPIRNGDFIRLGHLLLIITLRE